MDKNNNLIFNSNDFADTISLLIPFSAIATLIYFYIETVISYAG